MRGNFLALLGAFAVGCGGSGGGPSAPSYNDGKVVSPTISGIFVGRAVNEMTKNMCDPNGVRIDLNGTAKAAFGGYQMDLKTTEYENGAIMFAGLNDDGPIWGRMTSDSGYQSFEFKVGEGTKMRYHWTMAVR